MNKPRLSADMHWDVERYVLGDPGLDRGSFEAAMSADVELALAVAESVERLQQIARACQFTQVPLADSSKATPRAVTSRPVAPVAIGLACAVLAASLLVVFFNYGVPSSSQAKLTAQVDPRLSAVASHWLALDGVVVGDVSSGSTETWEAIESQSPSQLSVADEGDWMLEAAVAFFQQAEI